MAYKIGSFNLMNLNFRSDKEIKKEFDRIARIIKKENFDVIAMQEVLTDAVWRNALKRYFPEHYKFSWEKPMQYSSGGDFDKRGEGYAFIWNSHRLDLAKTLTLTGYRESKPTIWKNYRSKGQKLIREPYYARFTPCDKIGGSFFELRLICTHIVFGDSMLVRHEEYKKLVNQIFPKIEDKRYGNMMPAYTVLLGDYNLKSSSIEAITVDEKGEKRKVITLQNEPTTLNQKKNENDETISTGYTENDYDHFSVNEKLNSRVNIHVSRVDAVNKYCDGDFTKYRKTVSDHIPIKMTVDLKG